MRNELCPRIAESSERHPPLNPARGVGVTEIVEHEVEWGAGRLIPFGWANRANFVLRGVQLCDRLVRSSLHLGTGEQPTRSALPHTPGDNLSSGLGQLQGAPRRLGLAFKDSNAPALQIHAAPLQ